MFLYFKVNEHLKDIMEQTQKLKDHHTVEASGGQKVHVLKKKGAFVRPYVHTCVLFGEALRVCSSNSFLVILTVP